MSIYKVLGLMSGTSLDGVDLAYCEFEFTKDGWKYSIQAAETTPYPNELSSALSAAIGYSAYQISELDAAVGRYYGELIRDFCKKHDLHPDFVSSHGHTIFHQPEKKFTRQIGDGAAIAAITGYDVICDFRSKDVALGGQGAPLVPAGDAVLFNQFKFCLNLGGIANITTTRRNEVIAFDICPANMALNHLASLLNKPYDKDGHIAAKGKADQALLLKLNGISYYQLPAPKSLGREWYEEFFLPLINDDAISVEDRMRTVCEHIGMQVAFSVNAFNPSGNEKMLITGGGALNPVLIHAIESNCKIKCIIPDNRIIEYKEALIFAFLGVLYIRNENNVMSTVTGAARNHIGGALYKGK